MAQKINIQEFLNKTPGERLKALIASNQLAIIIAIVVVMIFVLTIYGFINTIFETSRAVSLTCVKMYAVEIRKFTATLYDNIDDVEKQIVAAKQEAAAAGGTKSEVVNKLEGANVTLRQMRDNIYQFRDYTKYTPPSEKSSLIASPAYAAEQTASAQEKAIQSEKAIPADAKKYVLALVLVVLSSAFIVSIVAIFRTKDAEVLRFAFDTVKTLLGFFIGVATTLLGT